MVDLKMPMETELAAPGTAQMMVYLDFLLMIISLTASTRLMSSEQMITLTKVMT